jgi:nucleoside-diphosphate-sugar epimerase
MRLMMLTVPWMQSAFTSSRDRRHSTPSTSSLPNGSQFRRSEPASNGFVHVSGIGADARSPSLYIRKRGEGELAVREAFADAILIRPAVMFGSDDAFLTTILKLLERLLIYPMFGNGQMRLQPVYVEDVGDAIAKLLQRAQTRPFIFECGGPRVYSYEEILKAVASAAGIKPMLIRVPFGTHWLGSLKCCRARQLRAESSGTNENRHHLSGGHTRNGGTWNLPTFESRKYSRTYYGSTD